MARRLHTLTRRERVRFGDLKCLDERCKEKKLGINLEMPRHLRKIDGNNSRNSWVYERRGHADRSPVKASGVIRT